jgi:hypothetical protein
MSRIEEEGQLHGATYGFKDRNTTFTFHGGGRWRQQNEYKYNYSYAYMPNARVVDEMGRYVLYIEGIDEAVELKREPA